MKCVALDIETTGTDPIIHSVLEIAMYAMDTQRLLPRDQTPLFHCVVQHKVIFGTAEALHMNARLLKIIRDSMEEKGQSLCKPEDASRRMARWLADQGFPKEKGVVTASVAGKNAAGFDVPFLKMLPQFEKLIRFHSRILDPAILFYQPQDTTLPSLSQCLARAGLNPLVHHTAADDAWAIVELLQVGLLGASPPRFSPRLPG